MTPEQSGCTHLNTIEVTELPASVDGCEDCLRTGGVWLHLRICLECGHVGCCDDSPGQHASAHARPQLAPDHPLAGARRAVELVLCRRDRDADSRGHRRDADPAVADAGRLMAVTTDERDQPTPEGAERVRRPAILADRRRAGRARRRLARSAPRGSASDYRIVRAEIGPGGARAARQRCAPRRRRRADGRPTSGCPEWRAPSS